MRQHWIVEAGQILALEIGIEVPQPQHLVYHYPGVEPRAVQNHQPRVVVHKHRRLAEVLRQVHDRDQVATHVGNALEP